MWRLIFVSSVEIAQIFPILFLAAPARNLYEWKWADEYFQNPVSILAKVGGWNDPRDLLSRSSFPGSALYFLTPFVWSLSLITLEWQWDGRQIEDGFFFSLQEVLFCPDGSEKSPSHSAELWWKCHHFLSLNLTWGDVSKMAACPPARWAALFWKACRGSIFPNLLPQCRSRRCPSRTSSGTHLHSRPFSGCNTTTCRSNLLWWIQPLKQKHFYRCWRQMETSVSRILAAGDTSVALS